MKKFWGILFALLAISTAAYGQQDPAAVIRFGPTLPVSCQPAGPNIFFKTAATVGLYQCTSPNTWVLLDSGGAVGDVSGPASSTDNAVVRFDLATGKLLQNSTVIIGDTGNVTGLGTLNTHTLPGGTDTIALIAASQSLSNKTLAAPVITGTITFPDGVRQIFNPNGTNAGINVGANAGEPSAPVDGDLFIDTSAANALKARINGAWVSLGSGGGGTPTLITVANSTDTTAFIAFFDSATGDLGPKTNAGITFNGTTGVLTATGFSGPITGAVTGNASTATTLQTPRTIGGVSFNGSANITVASATGGFAVTGANLTLGTDLAMLIDEHATAPGTPSAGNVILYAKQDGLLYSKDDAGVETVLAGSGANTVTAAATFGTDNVVVRADGTSRGSQASLVTINDAGDIETPAGIATGVGGGVAGFWGSTEGTAPSLVANAWLWYSSTNAPDTGAAYVPPNTSGTGVMFVTNTGGVHNITHEGTTGTGSFVREGSPTLSGTMTASAITVNTGLSVAGGAITNNVVQNSQSAAYVLVLSDAGKHILHPTADNNARTYTIPANSSVAFPIGTCITFVNQINTITISITTDTLVFAGTGATGSRTLAANGIATAMKITNTIWIINGTGLT